MPYILSTLVQLPPESDAAFETRVETFITDQYYYFTNAGGTFPVPVTGAGGPSSWLGYPPIQPTADNTVWDPVNGQLVRTVSFSYNNDYYFKFLGITPTIPPPSPLPTIGDMAIFGPSGTVFDSGLGFSIPDNNFTNLTSATRNGQAVEYSQITGFGTGSVTSVSVVSANGFAGTVATATTTPAITIQTSINGVIKGNGTTISAVTSADITTFLLTGYAVGANTALAATDSILAAFGKVQGQINAISGSDVQTVNLVAPTLGNIQLTVSNTGVTGTLQWNNLGLEIPQADTDTTGLLSFADWNTFSNKQPTGNYITALTGDVTAAGPGSVAATIANNVVTYAKIQAVSATSKLLGSSSTTTPVQEIVIGAGLTLTGTTLTASGSGGTVTSFSSGNLSPLFTTSVGTASTTPALTFALSIAGAITWFGNNTAGPLIPAYNSIGTLSRVNDTNVTLTLGGAPSSALLNSTSLTLGWTGALAETRGGTNQSVYATGDTLYGSGVNTLSKLTIGSSGQVLTVSGGIPSWATPTAGTVTSVSGTANRITSTGGTAPVIDISASYVGQSSITTVGTLISGATGAGFTIALGSSTITGTLPITNGGTNNTTQVTNGVNYFDGTRIRSLSTFLFDGTSMGIGVVPDSLLTVSKQTTIISPPANTSVHFIGLDANPLRITLDTHDNVHAGGTAFLGRRSRGTAGAPLAVSSGDTIITINGTGYGTTAFAAASTGLISIKANQNYTDTAMGTYVTIFTTPDASVTAAEALRITGAGVVNAIQATGKYQINSVDVLSSTTLGTSVVSSSLLNFGVSPIITTPNIVGSSTNDSAVAGSVGELLSQTRLRSAAAALTTGTALNITATPLTLTAGDWDVSVIAGFLTGTGTSVTSVNIGVSLTSATLPATDTSAAPTAGEVRVAQQFSATGLTLGNAAAFTESIPRYRISISASTTFYLVAVSTFAVSTLSVFGSIIARRIR